MRRASGLRLEGRILRAFGLMSPPRHCEDPLRRSKPVQTSFARLKPVMPPLGCFVARAPRSDGGRAKMPGEALGRKGGMCNPSSDNANFVCYDS